MKKISLFLFALLILAACAPATAQATSEVSKTSEVLPTATPLPTKTPRPTAKATALKKTETPSPEADYPVFDKAEDILTPEKLPFVDIADANGLPDKNKLEAWANTVLKMYKEGKIRQISPDAKLYPFQWGNKFLDEHGFGPPISIFMKADEEFSYRENPPYTFALFQSEFLGEKVALIATIWLNRDGSVGVMPQTKTFSMISKYPNEQLKRLAGFAPLSFVYNSPQNCLGLGINSQDYCDYHMSVQDEWLGLVKIWVESGIMPVGLSRYPLVNVGNTSTYFTNLP